MTPDFINCLEDGKKFGRSGSRKPINRWSCKLPNRLLRPGEIDRPWPNDGGAKISPAGKPKRAAAASMAWATFKSSAKKVGKARQS